MHDFLASIPSNAEGCAACAPLDDFLVISASGADALTFLHGQLTQDVTGLPADAARLAGYCTAKGRLLATLLMWRAAPGAGDEAPQLYALLRQDLSQALLKRLSMFVLRAKASWPRPRCTPAACAPPTTPSWPRSKPPPARCRARPGNAPSCRRAPGSPRPRRPANGAGGGSPRTRSWPAPPPWPAR